MRRIALVLVGLGLLAGAGAGCGGASALRHGTVATQRPDTVSTPARGSDVAVVRAWARAVAHGRFAAAARLFALPSLYYNGGPVLRLTTRAQVRQVTRLPCGARLLRAVHHAGYVIARFRLVQRPGAHCTGAGEPAYTAFKIRGGRIVRWIRVAGLPRPGAPPHATPLIPRLPAPESPSEPGVPS